MDLLERHARALAEFDRRVERLPSDLWDAPTACERWDVRTLVNHIVAEQLWAPHLLAGATLEEVGDRYEGDVLGDDPRAAWRESSSAAREALERPGALDGTVHSSMGELPAREYVHQMTVDLAVHAWDLTPHTGLDDRLDAELAEQLHRTLEPQGEELAQSGMFAAPVPVPDDADPQRKLLGLLGRDHRP